MSQLSTTVTAEEIECLAKNIGVDVNYPEDNVVQRVFDKATALNDSTEEDLSLARAVSAIVELAMLSKSILDINVEYSPEDAMLSVKAFPVNTNYFGLYKNIFNRGVYIDQPSSRLQVQTLEDDLIELIANAKDKAMGAL